jgi:thiosulfate reductase cytochrome b subunit
MSDDEKISVTNENLALHIQYIRKDLREICHKLDSKYVTKAEFNPVRLIAYGLVSVLLVAVISALIGKVGI